VSNFSGDDAARLLELLRQEFEIFGRIRELTKEQTELIAADDIEAFNISLDRRQEFIEKINGLHQESEALMQSYMLAGKTGGETDAAAKRLRDVISECAALNDKNMAAAKEKAEYYKERSGRLSLGRKSLGSYIHDVENDPEHFDAMT